MVESLLDIKQTAAYLKMNKMTVYKLAREGRIPAFKIASEWRFKKELIDQWLLSQMSLRPRLKGPETGRDMAGRPAVLVVDDETVIREYFERSLSDYRVMTAASGEEALDQIRSQRPDIVLLDIRMPGMDGIETLKKIKEFDQGIVVVILSAFTDPAISIEAARFGAYASLAKPFDLDEMKKILEDARQGKIR
ncbi:MAG: response regulator [Candidatus Omnitrophica bacterium]|nr:response regulator [Candidatus Omnitrophota bacterium]